MRDRPDRLKKLGHLDVEAWPQWRQVRNRLTHETPCVLAPEINVMPRAGKHCAALAMMQALVTSKARLPDLPAAPA